MSPELQWRAVMARDARFDGAFVYGVRSTRVYCRPSCPSRRPASRHVTYFDKPADAEHHGFRACLRCRPREARLHDAEVVAVIRACRAIERGRNEATLAALSKTAGMSPSRLRRTFSRIVGVSPKTYAEAWRVDQMKTLLQNGESITSALYGAGYSSPSRIYGGSSSRLGMTPGEYREGGPAVTIRFTITGTSLGRMLVAATARGVCAVKLGTDDAALTRELGKEFDAAQISQDDAGLATHAEALRRHIEDRRPTPELPLDVRATAFQARVWDALRKIPYGETRTYSQVAKAIGKPSAVRAVARACATNPAALVIPCHRVVREDGELAGYRWGVERKEELLKREKGEKGKGKREE